MGHQSPTQGALPYKHTRAPSGSFSIMPLECTARAGPSLHLPTYHILGTMHRVNNSNMTWPLAATDSNAIFERHGLFHVMHQTPTTPPKLGQADYHASYGHVVSRDLIHWKRVRNSLDPGASYDSHDGDCDGSVTLPFQSGFAQPLMSFGPDCARALPRRMPSSNDAPRVGFAKPADPTDPLLEDWIKDPQNPISFGSSPPCSFSGHVWRDPHERGNTSLVCCINSDRNAWGRYTTNDPSLHGPWHLADPNFATWRQDSGEKQPRHPIGSISGPSFVRLPPTASTDSGGAPPHSHMINALGGRAFAVGSYDAQNQTLAAFGSAQLVESVDSTANWFVAGEMETDGRVLHIGFHAPGTPNAGASTCLQWWPHSLVCPQTLIRSLTYDVGARTLVSQPAAEYANLRDRILARRRHVPVLRGVDEAVRLHPVNAGAEMDLELEVDIPADPTEPLHFGLHLLAPRQLVGRIPSPATRVSVYLGPARLAGDGARNGTLTVTSARGNATGLVVRSQGILVLPGEETIDLRILVDRSIVEVFAARGRAVASTRDYPAPEETGLWLWAASPSTGPVRFRRVDAWSMACGWTDVL